MDLNNLLSPSNLVASGSLLIVLKTLWSKVSEYLGFIFTLIKESILYKVSYGSNQPRSYAGALRFLVENGFLEKARNIIPSILNSELITSEDRIGFKFYKNNLVFFNFTFRDLENGVSTYSDGQYKIVSKEETLNIFYIGFSKCLRDTIIDDIKDLSKERLKQSDTLYVIKSGQEYTYPKRKENSIFLPQDDYQNIKTDISDFLSRESLYRDKSILYKRVYLLEGVPGTGKTSLVKALASGFNKSLHIISNINDLQDEDLILACKNKECFCLIEEIDTFVKSREDNNSKKETSLLDSMNSQNLQSLLTSLDGVMTPHGLILFMTTNFICKLDKALIRPGRVDYKLTFNDVTDEQIKQACKFYVGNNWKSTYKHIKSLDLKTMADVQEVLIQKCLV